jgi:DNA polymerase-3 subunit delta'
MSELRFIDLMLRENEQGMSWKIIGHDWAVVLLRQAVATGRVAHAYLISGPPQIGKTRLALVLAQALQCRQPDPPCGACAACLKIEHGTHPDVRVIVGEGAGGSLKIDQIRALQREVVLAPYEGRYRVLILRRMDLATLEAANSLLKTLEEPPAHVVLVLTAEHAELLPPTVVSRCQRLDLRAVPLPSIELALHDRGVPAPRTKLLARLSAGRVGWAFQAAQDSKVLRERQQGLDQLVRLLSADRVERLDFAWKVSQDPVAGRALIQLWTTWWRDLLLLCGRDEDHVVNIDRGDELRGLAHHSHWREVWPVVKALQAASVQLEANVNARLAWEGLLLALPHWEPVVRDSGIE